MFCGANGDCGRRVYFLTSYNAGTAPDDRQHCAYIRNGDGWAHVKAALTMTSLSIPIAEGRTMLGTWQGLYLFEHRRAPHPRQVVVHVFGDA